MKVNGNLVIVFPLYCIWNMVISLIRKILINVSMWLNYQN